MYLPYCDGASWAGRATHITRKRVPHQHARDKVYYRGNYILDATIDELLARGMDRADEVVVSGASAGGLAVYMHVDTWAAKIAAAAQVRDLPFGPLETQLSDASLPPVDEPSTSIRVRGARVWAWVCVCERRLQASIHPCDGGFHISLRNAVGCVIGTCRVGTALVSYVSETDTADWLSSAPSAQQRCVLRTGR